MPQLYNGKNAVGSEIDWRWMEGKNYGLFLR